MKPYSLFRLIPPIGDSNPDLFPPEILAGKNCMDN